MIGKKLSPIDLVRIVSTSLLLLMETLDRLSSKRVMVKIRLHQTSRNNGGPHGNNLSKIGYAEIKNSANFTGNVSFTTLKLQGNGAIYTFGSNYSYSVSETFELGQAGCAITTLKASSPGTAR